MGSIFDSIAERALEDAGGNYTEARRQLVNAKMDNGGLLAFHYSAALGALEAMRRAEREDDDA
jgi:D-alanyl-D-alanine dipeptidase